LNTGTLHKELSLEELNILAISLKFPHEFIESDLEQGVFLLSEKSLKFREKSQDKKERPLKVDILLTIKKLKEQFRRLGYNKEPLARAIGVKNKPDLIIDATCGMGNDTAYFLALGLEVHSVERNPIIGLLQSHYFGKNIDHNDFRNYHFEFKPAGQAVRDLAMPPCVIYYDPMYADKNEKALPKRNMKIFRKLVGPDADIQECAADLLTLTQRLVVKRPVKANEIFEEGKHKVDFTSKGKSTRYDVYLNAKT
jgi:16S rRNA (guanine1516-N2)-methyltransferase